MTIKSSKFSEENEAQVIQNMHSELESMEAIQIDSPLVICSAYCRIEK